MKMINSTTGHRKITALGLTALTALAPATSFFQPRATAYGETRNDVAIKTNLLYDATTTPNLGLEVGIGNKNSIQVVYGLNLWKFNDGSKKRQLKHWVLMPEFRWWTCTKFNGHFFGVHLMGGEYNAANINLPVPGFFFGGENLQKGVKDFNYQGQFAGVGLTYGYQWILSKHWNLEAEIGIGYNHVWYDKYPCYECGAKISAGHTNYAGITKLGLSILYIF